MILTIPKKLTYHFQVRILADTGFGSIEMLEWVRKRKTFHPILGIRNDRRLMHWKPSSSSGKKRPASISSWYEFSRDPLLVLVKKR